MIILKIVGLVWFTLIIVFIFGLILGYFIENKMSDDKPLKKWWRKNIIAPDPHDENTWKNFGG